MASPSIPALPHASRLSGLSQNAIRSVVAAAQALELGQVDEADRQLIGLLALHPHHPEVLRLVAGAQTLRGDSAGAIDSMRRAIAARPDDALYHNTLAAAQIDLGDYDGAIATLQRACELDAGLVVAWFNLGLVLMRSMRVEESASALKRVLELAPDHATARVMLADMLRAEGRSEPAIAEYRKVIARHPAAGMAWWGLADIKNARMDADDISRLRRAIDRDDASDADRVAMGFALAKALADVGEYAASLDALARADARARQHRQWNPNAHAAHLDSLLATFADPPSGAPPSLGSEVIFIASLPRSGSTLVEQVLASHSQIEGAGELPDLPMVLTEESRRRGMPFQQWVASMQPDDWQRLGKRYLERTAHWRERHPRFTDKLPYNWYYVGAIRAMLPGARIVIVRRDPLETCFSCYRQHLANNEYTRTFGDLAAFWRDFDRASQKWRAMHPGHIREQVYEDLVTQPEAQIRSLLEFCALPFEPACLAFDKTIRDVHTPSAMQVREPLRTNTAQTALYGSLLDPLRSALGLPPFTMKASA